MTRTIRDSVVDALVALSGSDERVEELRNHFADERTAGRSASVFDVASLLPLVVRSCVRRAVLDLSYWPAGVALAWTMLMVFANSYPLGWDQVGVDEFNYTSEALRSMRIVDSAFLVGPLAAIPAGARMVKRFAMGKWSMAGVVAAMLSAVAATAILAISQPNRVTSFRPEEVNEVPALLVGSFLAVALLPVLYLVADSLARIWKLWAAPSAQI